MSFIWEEPEYLKQTRELATRFNKISGMSGMQKSVTSFQSALKAVVPTSSMDGMKATMQAIQLAMPAAHIQNQLPDIVGQQMTFQSALQLTDTLRSVAESLRPMYEMQSGLLQLLGNQKLLGALQESHAWQQNLTGVLEAITPLLPKIDVQAFAKPLLENNSALTSFLAEYARNFNFDKLDIQDGALVYDGREYSIDDLQLEIDDEIEAVENKQSLREKTDKNNGLFIIGVLISLFLLFPQIDEAIPWYAEKYEALQAYIQLLSGIISQETYAFTIKEATYLRAKPNAKSQRITTVLYDTKLRIISSDTPRWLCVEYTDEQGTTIVGWVSKVSVEMDE
jgi:hypothetical protein